MNGLSLAILIIIGIILLIILWQLIKPYIIRYDSTICITGGLGAGKTLNAVKIAIVLLRKARIKVYWTNKWRSFINFFKNRINARIMKHNYKYKDFPSKQKKLIETKPIIEIKPKLYSNIPIHFKKHLFGLKREWACTLKASHLLCLEQLPEYSIVFVDELPQFINQFNWNQELIQKNVNEFITFFRHYVGGTFIVTAQSQDDIVVQIRRKLNQAIWCFNFRAWPCKLIPIFYTVRMCDIILSDSVQTMSTTYIEENTRLKFGLFPPKGTYDTRCYSERMKNVYKKYKNEPRYKKLKINKVLRLVKYISPLDDKTTEIQKEEQWKKGAEIWEN